MFPELRRDNIALSIMNRHGYGVIQEAETLKGSSTVYSRAHGGGLVKQDRSMLDIIL